MYTKLENPGKNDFVIRGPKKAIASAMTKKFEKGLVGLYETSEERRFLDHDVEWLGGARMIYVAVLDTIHSMYGGLMDYGYIRLVSQWLQKRGLTAVNEALILQAEEDILPSENYQQLLDKIKILMPRR